MCAQTYIQFSNKIVTNKIYAQIYKQFSNKLVKTSGTHKLMYTQFSNKIVTNKMYAQTCIQFSNKIVTNKMYAQTYKQNSTTNLQTKKLTKAKLQSYSYVKKKLIYVLATVLKSFRL
jgi:hypothetical protein